MSLPGLVQTSDHAEPGSGIGIDYGVMGSSHRREARSRTLTLAIQHFATRHVTLTFSGMEIQRQTWILFNSPLKKGSDTMERLSDLT